MSNKKGYAFLPAQVYVRTNYALNFNEPKLKRELKPQRENKKTIQYKAVNPTLVCPRKD